MDSTKELERVSGIMVRSIMDNGLRAKQMARVLRCFQEGLSTKVSGRII
jgi:hypothetical protein